MFIKKIPCYKQGGIMDCAPACLKILAEFYGKQYTLNYLRNKCGTNKEGTSFLNLGNAAEKIGFHTLSIKATLNDLLYKIPLPVIVHLNNNHFVVVYNVEIKRLDVSPNKIPNGIIYVSDPAQGYKKYNIVEFSKKWLKIDTTLSIREIKTENVGFLMVIEPKFKLLK